MIPPVPGYVYDFSFMDANDMLRTTLLASTSSHLLWPGATGNVVPAHLIPGASFADHHGPPYLAEAPMARAYARTVDDREFTHSDQLLRQDCTAPGTWQTHTHHLAGGHRPFSIPHSTREDITPFFDSPDPSPVPINYHDVWIEHPSLPVGGCNSCNFVAKFTPWDVLNPFEPGFDIQTILPTPCEGPSDGTYKCEWRVDGSPCNKYYLLDSDLKHSVSQHLSKAHNLPPAGGKSTQRCLWLGCGKELKRESIVRHILTVHLHTTTMCKGCGTSFARQDSLQRHMRNSCGAGTRER